MKILYKYATRERPEWFKRTLRTYYRMMSNDRIINYQFLISIDEDDKTMNNPDMLNWLSERPFLTTRIGLSTNKIEAINADMNDGWKWDIVVVVSDDMIPIVQGYDAIIHDAMKGHFPDTDGALHFNDDMFGKDRTITLSIMGRKLYERFGYIYHPDYRSFYCDDEFTEVVTEMQKVVYYPEVIISHKSWHGGGNSTDALYRKNSKASPIDKQTYALRKAKGFPKESVL